MISKTAERDLKRLAKTDGMKADDIPSFAELRDIGYIQIKRNVLSEKQYITSASGLSFLSQKRKTRWKATWTIIGVVLGIPTFILGLIQLIIFLTQGRL